MRPYCAGHMFQAAIAHHRATGKTTFLDVARRFADHLCDTFGPEDQGKRFLGRTATRRSNWP